VRDNTFEDFQDPRSTEFLLPAANPEPSVEE